MFIPYSDDSPTVRTPIVNYLLIAINVLVFFSVNLQPNAWTIMEPYALHPDKASALTLITYMFLHGGFFTEALAEFPRQSAHISALLEGLLIQAHSLV